MLRASLTIFATLWSATYACNGMGSMPTLPSIPSVPAGDDERACLHPDAEVLMPDGKSTAKAGDLVIGDYVWSENGSTPVILTPTFEKDTTYSFIQFKTNRGHGTTLTLHHAVFARPCGGDQGEPWPIKRADDLMLGECVPTVDGEEDSVESIRLLELQGKIHVITDSGKIASGGVILSCYDFDQKTQNEAHAPLQPVRMLYDWAEKIYNSLSDEEYAHGILNSLVVNLGLDKLHSQ